MARTDRKPRQRLDPDARKAAILDAAADVFVEQAYGEVTVSAVAARAGASEALIYRYFTGKEGLYVALVQLAIDDLRARHDVAQGALPAGVSLRDRVRESVIVHLDHIAGHPAAWAAPLARPGSEPATAAALRVGARREYVDQLRDLLNPSAEERHEYALWGYFGFLDAVCLRWVEQGCPVDGRWPLVDTALGALEGALGDWAA